MTALLGVAGIIGILSIPAWFSYFAHRWGSDPVPHAARQWRAPDPEWEPWAYLDFPTPADVPALPAPRPATYWVGEPEQLPAPRPRIGPGR